MTRPIIPATRFLLFITSTLLLFTSMAVSASAQKTEPTPNINDPVMRFPSDSIKATKNNKVFLTTSIVGKIRWKKEYGLPSIDGGRTPDKATNCTAIRVQATVQEGAPGTFGKAVNVGYIGLQNEPTEENGYYTCSYSITDRNNDLPRNRVITISAFLGPYASPDLNRALVTGTWYGGSEPQPPLGYQRVVDGGRGVTLTDNAPRTTVDFEVVYKLVPQGPR
ncbi:MAG TPA: hypothetical protein VGC66_25285 [Pyrinomonadaceae bacterium]|jgi:hypothetical protein